MSESVNSTSELSLECAYAHGIPIGSALMRTEPEDFVVTEELGFEPTGEGEHAFLIIRKRNTNSEWVARQIAKLVDVKKMDVGFAGMKDRRAVTTQAFTVKITGKSEPDWSELNLNQDGEQIEVISSTYHQRKLKRGELLGNRFNITLRQVDGERSEIEQRLELIRQRGFPNYFGEQRFGFDGNNLLSAAKMFSREMKVKDRAKRGIYLSAVRSYLFNRLLSLRVEADNWQQVIAGDWVWTTEDTRGFTFDNGNPKHVELLGQNRLIVGGPLWGDGRALTQGEALQFEQQISEPEHFWIEGLKAARMDQSRRALQVKVDDLQWHWNDSKKLSIEFSLPSGSYATSLLREICLTIKSG
ncbi:MAG TPA: tRNA pseudouridine(13) synthase TruD [Ectothiorhodospiraceae bacterium]|nr:tRNA pseudouridine(13) synthase TruD [Ectothiorhodospiraceae bacterium]